MLSPDIMSTSVSHLAELPAETLEHVLLHLPVQDIVKVEAVNRRFQDLIRNSPALQHQRKLFAVGLIDNPCNPCDLAQRRRTYEEYTHKWSRAATLVKSTHKFPSNQSPRWDHARPIGRNMLVSYTRTGRGLDFLCIPPATSREPVEIWSIPSFSFKLFASLAIYHPDNLLVVAEHDRRELRIHLLNQDGSPYYPPPRNIITWDIPQDAPPLIAGRFSITSSRIMACLCHFDADTPPGTGGTVLVWDRKTGDLILNLLTMDWRGLNSSGVIFLDEFQIMITARDTVTDAPKFTVYNTLIPQDHPMSSRTFVLPPVYHDRVPRIHADRDRSLGTPNRDGPLITDPTQAILVLELLKSRHEHSILLVVQIQPLIDRVCSTRTDVHIPWDEWGRGSVIIEKPPRYGSFIHIHGTHLVALETPYHWQRGRRGYPRVRVFDFSRNGRSALPLRDGEGGGTERKVMFSDGSEFVLEADEFKVDDDDASWGNMGSQGDGTFFLISQGDDGPGSDFILNVWELT